MMEKKQKAKTGIITTLLVYDGNALVGNGWFIFHDGRSFEPTLISIDGSPLTQGWYNIIAAGQYLAVINGSIH